MVGAGREERPDLHGASAAGLAPGRGGRRAARFDRQGAAGDRAHAGAFPAGVYHPPGRAPGARRGERRRRSGAWRDQAGGALEIAAKAAGAAWLLAVENLEGYPLDFWEPMLERSPVSRCVDVGHLWLDGSDPLPFLERALPRTSVVHLHGIDQCDHASLAFAPAEQLDRVFQTLVEHSFSGIVTLEVFGESDFHSSLAAVKESLNRVFATSAREEIQILE